MKNILILIAAALWSVALFVPIRTILTGQEAPFAVNISALIIGFISIGITAALVEKYK